MNQSIVLLRIITRRRKPWSRMTKIFFAGLLINLMAGGFILVVSFLVPAVRGLEMGVAALEFTASILYWHMFQASRKRDES